MSKKITLHGEFVYVAAILLLSLAVAMLSAANFGVSMIVAPAYIISQKLGVITFGQGEYLVQSLLFIVFCILMKKVKLVYFSSFATCLIYGAVLDLWRKFVPLFNGLACAYFTFHRRNDFNFVFGYALLQDVLIPAGL